jgi:hypothetical protein
MTSHFRLSRGHQLFPGCISASVCIRFDIFLLLRCITLFFQLTSQKETELSSSHSLFQIAIANCPSLIFFLSFTQFNTLKLLFLGVKISHEFDAVFIFIIARSDVGSEAITFAIYSSHEFVITVYSAFASLTTCLFVIINQVLVTKKPLHHHIFCLILPTFCLKNPQGSLLYIAKSFFTIILTTHGEAFLATAIILFSKFHIQLLLIS